MEQRSFGLLLEDVIGKSHEDSLIEDQMILCHQKFLVVKGSLLTVMSQTEARIINNDNKSRHNYKLVSGYHTITLHCKPSQVFPITKNQRALLSGVPRESDRIEVLHNLDWVEKLHYGSFVYVTIPTIPTPVKGLVYHLGPVKGEAGIKFGIELQERRGEGTSDGTFNDVDYFECDPDCGVFVSMDKLTQKESFEATKVVHAKEESPQPEDDRPFKVKGRVRIFNKNGIAFKGTIRSIKKDVLGIEAEQSLARADFPEYVEDSKKRLDFTITRPHHSKLFLPAHLVKHDQPEASSKESSAVNKNAANGDKSSQKRKNSGKPDAGVSSHMGIDNDALEEIKKAGINPGTAAVVHQRIALKQFEAEQKQQLAKPKKNKEMIEYKKQIQEVKNELKLEDWLGLDTSLLDIEKQERLLEEATHDEKMQEEKMFKDKIMEVIRLQEEKKRLQEEIAQQQKEEAARKKRLQEENRLHEEATQQKKEEAAQQKKEEAARQNRIQGEAAPQERWMVVQLNKKTCQTYAANKYDENDSHEEYFDTSDTLPNKQKSSPADAVYIPRNHGNFASSDSLDPDHFANHPQHNVVRPSITTQSYSERNHKFTRPPDPQLSRPNPQSSNDNPHNLEVGSMIQFGNPPCYGVIKWMGTLPETEHVLMAGVEVDVPIEGYTKYNDGWYGGKRLFKSKINRGVFLPLKGLHPDKRFANAEAEELPNYLSGNLKANTVIHQQASISSDSQTKQSKISDDELNTISVTVNQLHQDMDKMKEKVSAVKEDVKTYTYKSEESIQRMEVNVESAFKKAMDAQKSNEELQASSVDVKNQLSLTQKQLLDVQKDKEHLQSQMSFILDKLSHAQQQMSDMQKSNEKLLTTCEKLQATNVQLQDQLSLTRQQLLGVQSMMTCSRLWVVSHDQFTIGREIGRGAWATVHEATFRGATVAAKRLHQLITVPRTRQLFQREMEMALHCQHQNIVTFLGATLEGPPVILMELMDTNLRSAYEQGQIQDHQVLRILHDVASALHFLHTRPDPVIHRDVSSANVLLKAQYNGEWLAKLGDLGTAKLQRLAITAGPGAIVYGAPEAADASKHSPKMDVYSFGVLIVEILTKTLPFETLTTLKDQVQQQFPQYHQLVTSCTNQQTSDRPTMYDVIHQLNIA